MPAQFVRRERKHRRLAKQKNAGLHPAQAELQHDANREVIVPDEVAAKDARRKHLQAELTAQSAQGKVTGKKRKRLDHYIETKLKREENAELIKRLASQHVDTSLLQSSKTLGRVNESKRDILSRALRERQAGIDSYGDQDTVLFTSKQKRSSSPQISQASDGATESDDDSLQELRTDDNESGKPVASTTAQDSSTSTTLFGSGLKRAHDETQPSAPIKRRKRRKKGSMVQAVYEEDSSVEVSEQEAGSPDPEETTTWQGFASVVESSESGHTSSSANEHEGDGSTDEDPTSDDATRYNAISPSEGSPKAERSSAFKQWAETQRNVALGFKPSTATTVDPAIKATFRPRQPSPDQTALALSAPVDNKEHRQLKAVVIERNNEIQKAREALPVVQEEQRIMEAIIRNPIVIICGATGSGKTTQVPQMMLENGYASHRGETSNDEDVRSWTKESLGMIGITQPRRVAAMSVAERVKAELGTTYASRVAHHVRYDTNVSRHTALKFMTDGILLRELHQDFILSKYSAIIIDEAHERSVNTDILIGTLSRIIRLREQLTKEDPTKHFPLKLVIMSATLRIADFIKNEQLFQGVTPPVIEVEGRQYSVTVHFARRTHREYEAEMLRKITKAHRKLPSGTILAFLTGQNEIVSVMKQLQHALGHTSRAIPARAQASADQLPLETDDMDAIDIPEASVNEDEFDGLEDEDEDLDIEDADNKESKDNQTLRAHILPLYAALPADQQMQVFKVPVLGVRHIILATNVAETSLTILGVRYVFDCGRSKEKKYENATGVSSFEIDWISKASASQRTGRAGRTGPGHCWRLYSSALYEEHFPEHSVPEILRTPVESIVLQLKAMNIDNVPKFPFPTPPDRQQLRTAERLLGNLGAITANGKLTEQGRELIRYPLNPRYGKILLLAARNNILDHAIALVAALAVGDIFLPDALSQSTMNEEYADDKQQSYGRAQSLLSRWDDQSDAIKMLTAVAVHAEAISKDRSRGGQRISQELYLRTKSMDEVQHLRKQLQSILRTQSIHATPISSTHLALPTPDQRKMLNQVVAAAFLDQIAIRADLLPSAALVGMKPRRAIEVPYLPLFPIDAGQSQPIFVHSSSILSRLSKDEMPNYVVYSHLTRAAAKSITNGSAPSRVRISPLTSVSGKVLALLAQDTPLLRIGKPIGKIEEQEVGKRRTCWVSIAMKAGSITEEVPGSLEWPMPAWRVEQTRKRNGDWDVVKVLSR